MKTHTTISIDSYLVSMLRLRKDINVSAVCEIALQTVIDLPENMDVDMKVLEEEKFDLIDQKRKLETRIVKLNVELEKLREQHEEEDKERELQSNVRVQVYKNMDILNKLARGDKNVMDSQ